MNLTTPARPVDVALAFRDIEIPARITTRLHPRAGTPGRRDSSLGGPLLWPVDEPWPLCENPRDHVLKELPGGISTRRESMPLIPILQLFARDVPSLPFPAGTNVFQLLWCPVAHEPLYAPSCIVRWRNSCGLLTGAGRSEDQLPNWAGMEYLPLPCELHPEQVADYPHLYEFNVFQQSRITRIADWYGIDYFDDFGAAPGSKVGGWVAWELRREYPVCACGAEMTHLVTIASAEFEPESSWQVVSDAPGPTIEERQPSGLVIGDFGSYFVFTCLACPHRPITALIQSSCQDGGHGAVVDQGR